MKPVMPMMDAVGSANRAQVENFMDEVFLVDVPDFKREGRLNIILETCFASMIRHLPEIVRLCGGHCLVATALFKAAEKIRLSDARFPDLDPKAVLLEWSKMVRADYKERFDIKSVEAMGSRETEDGGAMYKLMSQMAADVKELKDDKRNQELELARQRAMSQYQAKQIESLKAELEKERARSKAELEKERMRTKSLLQQMNSSTLPPLKEEHLPVLSRSESATMTT